MTTIEFNRSLRQLNKKYLEIFGNIPVIENYSCTRDEYVAALTKAVEEKVDINTLLIAVGAPQEESSII